MRTTSADNTAIAAADRPQGRASPALLLPFEAGVRFFVDQVRFWIQLPWRLFLPAPRPPQPPEVDENRLEATVADIRRLLRVAFSAGVTEDLTAALNKLAEKRSVIECAVVAWIDLIEVLIQYEEKQYGPGAGLGQLKAAELKSIFQYLLRNQEYNLPNIPEAIQPLVIDYIIDAVVQAVVTACNKYGLWEEEEASPSYPFRVFLARIKHFFGLVFGPLLAAIVRVIISIRKAFARNVVLSPEIRGAIEAVQKEAMVAQSGDVLREAINVIVFVGEHAEQMKAAFELVLTAVQEAETFSSLEGPEKKQYATNLVFAVLEELGFVEEDGLLGAVIESLISSGIEVAVHLFNKRGVFAN